MVLKVGHGGRQQRNDLLLRVLRQRSARQLFGDFGKDRGCRNRRIGDGFRARVLRTCPGMESTKSDDTAPAQVPLGSNQLARRKPALAAGLQSFLLLATASDGGGFCCARAAHDFRVR